MKNNSEYSGLTKVQAIKQILIKHELCEDKNITNILLAMEESFREGWLRGEEYGTNN